MGILDRLFGPAKKGSSGLFNQANGQWQILKDAILRGDDARAQSALLEVVRLCQEAIALDPQKEGDAYVLLTNALLRASQVYNNADERLLIKYAAACIHSWWTLPHKGWPVTSRNSYAIGTRWYQEVLQRLGGSVTAESTMSNYGSLYGKLVTSPAGFATIKVALKQSLPEGLTKGPGSDLREVLYSHWRYLQHGSEDGRQADFSYANLPEVDLSEVRLKEIYRQGFVFGKVETRAFIPGVPDASLTDAIFTGANLSRANLSGTSLYGAILTGANLTGANLAGANLGIGSLAHAELIGANLTGANLEYTSLEAANLSDAIGLTQKQIKSANIDELTRLPRYLQGPTQGGQETAGRNVNLPPFTEAIHLKPQNAREYFYRGVAYHHVGEYQHALNDFNEAVRLDPHNAQEHYYLGLAYYYDGQYQLAANSFGEVIRLTPHHSLAYNHRANCYLKLLQHLRAIEDYSAAIQLNPQCAIFYSNRGAAYRALGMDAEANQDSRHAAQLSEQP